MIVVTTASPRSRSSRLLRRPAIRPCRARDGVRRSRSSSTPPSRSSSSRQRRSCSAIGGHPARRRRLHPARPARWPADAGSPRSSAASTSRCSGSSSGSARRRRRCPADAPLAALGADRGWIVLLVLASGRTTPARTSSASGFGRREVPDPHLALEDVCRPDRRASSPRRSSSRAMLVGLGQPPVGAPRSGRSCRSAAQAGDLAESMLKRAAGAKDSGHADPGPRRRPRPGRLVPVRRAGRDPVCRRPFLRDAGAATADPGRPPRLDRLHRPAGARRPGRASGRLPRRRPGHRSQRGLLEQAAVRPAAVASGTGSPARPAGGRAVGGDDALERARDPRRRRPRRRRRPAGSSAFGRSSPRSRPARSWRRPTRRRSSPAATS